MKKFCNFFHCDMVGCFQRSLAGVEESADLAVFHLVEVAQLEDGALYVGQTGDGFLELCLCLVAVEVVVGHQTVGHAKVGIVGTDECEVLLSAHEVEALVDGNAREPRQELGVAVEVVEGLPRLDERILQDVVSIVVCEHDASDLPVQLFAVLSDDVLEGSSLRLGVSELL